MRHLLTLLLLIGILTACTKTADEPSPDDIAAGHKPGTTIKNATAEWKADNGGAGGFDYPESFKNYQFDYEVEGNNQLITYSLTSSQIEVAFFVYDANGARLSESEGGRNVNDEKMLNAGKYRIVVMAERYALGKFELKIGNIKKDIVSVSFEVLKSGDKSWGEYGGGGAYVTPKNHFYSFEVTEDNTYIDIEMESKDTEIGLYLYDTNGEGIVGDDGKRKHFVIAKLNKGIYQIMAATFTRGSRGNYTLKVFGKTQNLNKRSVSEKAIEGNIANNKDVKMYTIEITENSSLIDLQLDATPMQVAIHLYESSGKLVKNTLPGYNNSVALIERVQKGTYKVYVEPYPYGDSYSSNFKLVAVGNFK